jgi:hypothetical protein
MNEWLKCPTFYKIRRKDNLELITDHSATDFGTRMHELLENRFREMGRLPLVQYPPVGNPALENEAQVMFAAYEQTYPVENFTVLGVEELFEIPIPGTSHVYTGKRDLDLRLPDGRLAILDHKTEKRGSKNNLPLAWIVNTQASLYNWALRQAYPGEPVAYFIVDVLTRQSPAGREPATFRRDYIERTDAQIEDALRNLIYIADQIEEGEKRFTDWWPANRKNCVMNNWKCDYFALCHYGQDESTLRLYQPAKSYLEAAHANV